jgi:malonyl-CoA/methylmalonyl-CoA synthetase
MLSSNPCRADDGERVGGTVGPALPGVGIRIVDERDAALPAGDTGPVQVSGPNVFGGYWRMPEKTAEEFVTDAAGRRWFRTGDVGRLDERGYLSIVGRSKDLIITGGYNVYPKEVELALDALPEVKESAVIGLPHPDLGEAVFAVLVGGDPVASLAAIAPGLARFKQPRAAVVVEDLPRNTMGKVQKNILRARYAGWFKS